MAHPSLLSTLLAVLGLLLFNGSAYARVLRFETRPAVVSKMLRGGRSSRLSQDSCLTCRAMHALILMNAFWNRSVFLLSEVVLTRFLFSLLQQGFPSAFDGSQQAFASDATETGRSVSRNAYSRLSTDDNFLRSIFSSLSSRCVILAG